MATKTAQKTSTESNKKKGVSLKLSVFLVTLAAAIVPLGIFSYLNYQSTSERVTNNAKEALLSSNQSSSKLVKSWLDGNELVARALATTPEIVTMDPGIARPSLLKIIEQTPDFYTLSLVELSGQQITRTSDGEMVNVSKREYFQRIMNGDPSAIESGISLVNKKIFISFSAPIKKDGVLAGMFTALADIGPVTGKVTGGKIGRTGISYLVDVRSKKILAHPDIKLVAETANATVLEKAQPSNFRKIVDGLNDQKTRVKIVASPVSPELVLISEIDSNEVNEPIVKAQKSALVFIGLALALSSLLSFLLARAISNGISKLSLIVTSISRAGSPAEISRLERQVEDVGGSSELRKIASAILRLTASIKVAMRSM